MASLDRLSDGRSLSGVGAGWNREEMEHHGTDPRTRFSLMRERVEAMKAIWTRDEAEYHGRHVDFEPIWSWPKPAQYPHPPVLVGGNGAKVIDRVLAFGDEWLPNAGREDSLDAFVARVGALQGRAAEAGRDVPVTAFGAPRERDGLERLAEAGVHRAVLPVPPEPREEVAPTIEGYAKLARELQAA